MAGTATLAAPAMPPNRPSMISLVPAVASAIVSVPTASMTLAMPRVMAVCRFATLVWTPPVAVRACCSNETMPAPPSLSSLMMVSMNSWRCAGSAASFEPPPRYA